MQTISKVEKLLPLLIRNALLKTNKGQENNIIDFQLDHTQWNELLLLAAKQGVFAIAYDGLTDSMISELPKDIKIQWKLGIENIEKRYDRQVCVLSELISIFKKNDINLMLIKGLGLCSLYPKPNHRECGDLDIYLMGDYDKGNSIIEQMGIFVNRQDNKHSKFNFRGVSVENHKTFLNTHLSKIDEHINIELNNILVRDGFDTILIGDLSVNIPNPFFNAIFLARHSIVHFLSSGLVFRHFIDIALFYETYYKRINFNNLAQLLKRERLLDIYLCFLALTNRLFGFDKGYKTLVARVKNEYLPNEMTVNKIYNDSVKNGYKIDNTKNLLEMPVYKRKIIGALRLIVSKWKYDLIDKGEFYKSFLLSIWLSFKR